MSIRLNHGARTVYNEDMSNARNRILANAKGGVLGNDAMNSDNIHAALQEYSQE